MTPVKKSAKRPASATKKRPASATKKKPASATKKKPAKKKKATMGGCGGSPAPVVPLKGGSTFVEDVNNLLIPFGLLAARQGIQWYGSKAPKEDKPQFDKDALSKLKASGKVKKVKQMGGGAVPGADGAPTVFSMHMTAPKTGGGGSDILNTGRPATASAGARKLSMLIGGFMDAKHK